MSPPCKLFPGEPADATEGYAGRADRVSRRVDSAGTGGGLAGGILGRFLG